MGDYLFRERGNTFKAKIIRPSSGIILIDLFHFWIFNTHREIFYLSGDQWGLLNATNARMGLYFEWGVFVNFN